MPMHKFCGFDLPGAQHLEVDGGFAARSRRVETVKKVFVFPCLQDVLHINALGNASNSGINGLVALTATEILALMA